MNGKYFRFFERNSTSALCIVSSILGYSTQSFAYPPLPAYGQFSIQGGPTPSGPTCIAVSGSPTTVSWTARANGYGYQATQYQCSAQYYITGATGGTCTGGSAVISPTGMYTDSAGLLNPTYAYIKFIVNDTNNNCTSVPGNVITINPYVGCSVATVVGGGAFAGGTPYGAASCTAS